MQPSLARYLLVKLIPAAIFVNFVLNAAFGILLYPAGQPVPLHGTASVAGDTIVSAFFIGFFTLLTVPPGARREVWSGRVRGFGLGGLGWLGRHPVLSAIAFGIVTVLFLALPTMSSLDGTGRAAMSLGSFVVFKASFAGAAGVVAGIVAAILTIATEAPVTVGSVTGHSHDVGVIVYPVEYLDKGALAVSDNSRGCSGTPTWQLVVEGLIDPGQVRIAFADLVTRYPSLATKVEALDGVPAWAARFRYVQDRSFQVDRVFRVVDLRRRSEALDALICEEVNRPLDPYTESLVSLTLAITGDDACRLLFRQHHAIADGRAFIGLLADFAAFLESARRGTRPKVDALAPVGRVSEAAMLGLTPVRRALDTAAGMGLVLRSIYRGRRNTPLAQNRSNDYSGENGTVHLIVSDALLERSAATRKELGISLNSLLTGALFAAAQRWHRAMKLPLGRTRATLMMETRPRDDAPLSFANHLATLEVEIRLDREDKPVRLMQDVQRQAHRQRETRAPIKRQLFESLIARAMPMGDMRRIVFESKYPSANLNFSNLIPLGFPTLGGHGWNVTEVLITTPVTPRLGIVLTVIRYNGKLIFNFNYKSSAATRAETEALARHFHTVLAEVVARV